MSEPWSTRVSPFKDKFGIEQYVRTGIITKKHEWKFLFRLINGGCGIRPGKKIIKFDTPEEAEAYRLEYVEKISRPKKKKEPSKISTLHILAWLIAVFALFAHVYAIIHILKEAP
jgi:hypothetical protein